MTALRFMSVDDFNIQVRPGRCVSVGHPEQPGSWTGFVLGKAFVSEDLGPIVPVVDQHGGTRSPSMTDVWIESRETPKASASAEKGLDIYIIGTKGSGKTTLARYIARLLSESECAKSSEGLNLRLLDGDQFTDWDNWDVPPPGALDDRPVTINTVEGEPTISDAAAALAEAIGFEGWQGTVEAWNATCRVKQPVDLLEESTGRVIQTWTASRAWPTAHGPMVMIPACGPVSLRHVRARPDPERPQAEATKQAPTSTDKGEAPTPQFFHDAAGGLCFGFLDTVHKDRDAPAYAPNILRDALEAIDNRAAERDRAGGERSMADCVAAFNALTGHALTEREGWVFMAQLKLARAQGGRLLADDYIDGAAYMALAGEAALKADRAARGKGKGDGS